MKSSISHFFGSVVITSIALFFLDKINILSIMPFIPKDKLFDVALPLYVGAIELGCRTLLGLLEERTSSVIITFFSRGNNPELGVNPMIFFNKEDLAEVCLSVRLSGSKKAFQGKTIKIPSVDFASVQPGEKSNYITMDTDGSLSIDLQSLFGEVNITSKSSVSIPIVYIQEKYYDDREIDISPQFNGKRLYWFGYVKYEHNQYRLQIKSR